VLLVAALSHLLFHPSQLPSSPAGARAIDDAEVPLCFWTGMIMRPSLQLTRRQPAFACLGNSRTLAASRNWLLAGRKQTALTEEKRELNNKTKQTANCEP
jgi:hypothetical protein